MYKAVNMVKKEYLIEFYPDNKQIKVESGENILDAAISTGIYLTSICDGLGKCGKCKIIIEEGEVERKEDSILTKKEREDNYYLACQTYPKSDLKVIIPIESRLGKHQILEHVHDIEKRSLVGEDVGIAIDIGTTTIVAYLVDLSNNNLVDSASEYNKQMIYGEDILSRIDYAKKNGVEKLNRLVIETIDGLIERLIKDRKVKIKEIATAGNTTMTYMLLNKNPEIIKKNLDLEEFKIAHSMDLEKLGIKSKGILYSLPGIASYVGGDIVADIIASNMHKSRNVSMLIDIGTNGEVVIGNREFLVACSTSAGPAFEGSETRCGMRATTGAIEDIRIKENFEIEYATIHNDKARGICGSGFIDLIADLFLRGIIDHNGKFSDIKTYKIRDGESGKEFIVVSKNETATGKDIVITEKDIKGIMFSKAAIYAGASSLTKIGIPFEDLEKIYVAGGFGYYLDVEKAITLGLLPDLPREKFEFIGNGSAKGAYLTLTNKEKRKEAEEIARKTTYFDLSKEKTFNEEYMAALSLPHQDLTRFPSVEKKLYR